MNLTPGFKHRLSRIESKRGNVRLNVALTHVCITIFAVDKQ
jgi:hypothetical protein